MSSSHWLIESLEKRTMLSVSAPLAQPSTDPGAVIYQPMAAGPTLTLADRQELLNNWNGSNKTQLMIDLAQSDVDAFDQHLLDYMETRTNAKYFFKNADAAGIVNFINNDAGLVSQKNAKISQANQIVSHLFPEAVNSSTYTVQLPSALNWLVKPANGNSDFLFVFNQQGFWKDLAMAYRFTGSAAYITELISQLDSWSRQYTRLANPNDWVLDTVAPKWDLYTTSERTKNWLYAYNMVLGTSGWTATANTMFLHRLLLQGQFMNSTTKVYDLTSNKATSHATALYNIALVFPEFASASAWRSKAEANMFAVMATQFRADGMHYEQSPGYHGGAMAGFFDSYRLAALNGTPWTTKTTRFLRYIIEAFYQLLSPDGMQAALSDTYRSQGVTFFTRAAIILGETRWPKSRPRLDDVWQLGTAACQPLLGLPTYASSLPQRGTSARFTSSGYYVTRTGDDNNARQLIFDAGPKGGLHGHLDLLNFELYGYKKPLIADPGLMSYSSSYATERAYVISTPAHNTISVDGLSHAASEKSTVAALNTFVDNTYGVYMSATSYGYQGFKGAPVVSRNIWHNHGDIFVVVDFANSSFAHTYSQHFNLATTSITKFTGGVIRTTMGGGDVMLKPLLQTGQTVSAKSTILSNSVPPAGTATGTRFAITQTSKYAMFASLVVAYNGAVPNVSAQWLRLPTARRSGMLEVNNNGSKIVVYFAIPNLAPVAAAAYVYATPASVFASTPAAKPEENWLVSA